MKKEIDYTTFIGLDVRKKSNKPFKSGEKVNRVKSLTINKYTNKEAFTFYEDDSVVDCFRCNLGDYAVLVEHSW